jgi:hypothetical protein
LDYIGTDAYYPLTQISYPSIADILAGWTTWVPQLQNLSATYQKQIIFTEIGYQSVADATITPWAADGPLSLEVRLIN